MIEAESVSDEPQAVAPARSIQRGGLGRAGRWQWEIRRKVGLPDSLAIRVFSRLFGLGAIRAAPRRMRPVAKAAAHFLAQAFPLFGIH